MLDTVHDSRGTLIKRIDRGPLCNISTGKPETSACANNYANVFLQYLTGLQARMRRGSKRNARWWWNNLCPTLYRAAYSKNEAFVCKIDKIAAMKRSEGPFDRLVGWLKRVKPPLSAMSSDAKLTTFPSYNRLQSIVQSTFTAEAAFLPRRIEFWSSLPGEAPKKLVRKRSDYLAST